ncbi:hypothetical protein SAMN04489761_0140 [Tenacibaculum sp. MAR_2009_124]|uniref:hypothetical protein n=1 Tax=Tenacibaculum sp. MAR_2009_124 TaxID=1250059 RepID=UPI00089CBD85|nr:hypothetical protein [Tenacibaculum sp. MAR_2009_124]SEB36274.1 hypothetical protein SAMN04489761_0140 [Tenacibaculum sp. MAR_2009_124]
MIPTSQDFYLVYGCYIVTFILILIGYRFGRNKKAYFYHLMFYLVYTILMVFVYMDKDNFGGGASLVVLFYSGLCIVIHWTVFFLIEIIKGIRTLKF